MLQQTQSTSPRILYIDDDDANRTLVHRLLSNYDFEVIEAANGLEGIKLAKENPPHLILMDINMPGLDGHETTTRMRSMPVLERVPIVAITAYTNRGERELALAAGCDGYIPKPIDVDEFPLQIINYLDGRKDTLTADEHQHYLNQYSHKLVERLETKILELQEANTRLQKIDKLKSDFITLAAHELRTPISLVYGYARLLHLSIRGNEPDLPAEGSPADLADRVFHAVHRLNEVVNDILNIALIQANQIRIERQPVHLTQLIQTALRDLAPAENERALTISLQNLEDLPPITGDFQRLHQAFHNLLSNAIKYTPDGRSIVITGWPTTSSSLIESLPGPHPP
ncbi:MAG: response regulator [Anaerolineae bacterium]